MKIKKSRRDKPFWAKDIVKDFQYRLKAAIIIYTHNKLHIIDTSDSIF